MLELTLQSGKNQQQASEASAQLGIPSCCKKTAEQSEAADEPKKTGGKSHSTAALALGENSYFKSDGMQFLEK